VRGAEGLGWSGNGARSGVTEMGVSVERLFLLLTLRSNDLTTDRRKGDDII